MKVKAAQSCPLFVTPWTLQPVTFTRPEYQSGHSSLCFPSPGDLPNPGIEHWSPAKLSGKPILRGKLLINNEIHNFIKYSWFTTLFHSWYTTKRFSDAHTYSFYILLGYELLQDSEYSSLCYTVGPCCFPIPNWIVSIY